MELGKRASKDRDHSLHRLFPNELVVRRVGGCVRGKQQINIFMPPCKPIFEVPKQSIMDRKSKASMSVFRVVGSLIDSS